MTAATETIPTSVVTSIEGCWLLGDHERWRIRSVGDDGAEVRRELLDSSYMLDYARRAAIPSRLRYRSSDHTLGFPTAGRIHALIMTFTVSDAALRGKSFSSHDPSDGYHWTGNTFTLRRCDHPDR